VTEFVVRLVDLAKGTTEEVRVDGSPFGTKVLTRTLRDAIVAYEANRRQGTVNTKERGDVAGTTKKPWRQKHTGRARAGSKKSPLWRKGGTVFGPHPRDWRHRTPRRQLRVALRTALLAKLQDREVVFVRGLAAEAPSARAARAWLAALSLEGSSLFVLPEPNAALWKSLRNFPGVEVRAADHVNAYDALRSRTLVCPAEAWEKLRDRATRRARAEEAA